MDCKKSVLLLVRDPAKYNIIFCKMFINAYTMLYLRDMFHVYLNRFDFHFLRLNINKTNTFCFLMHNGRVPGIAK